MRISATGSLEAGVCIGQARGNFRAVGGAKALVRSPSSGYETLGCQHVEAIPCRSQVLFASESEIGLHRRAECVHVTVCMPGCKRVFAGRQWVKVRIMQIARSDLLVSLAGSSLEGEELVLWDRIRLIPGVGLVGARTPNLPLFDGLAGH